MRFSFFYHSLVSDWNHGNAHFLRGVVSELLRRGHQVKVYEPADSWSRKNLINDHGVEALEQFHEFYPRLSSRLYHRDGLDMESVAADSDVVIVHEWNDPWVVNGFGELRNRVAARGGNAQLDFRLLFHDTHHRAISNPLWLKRFNLENYDGVLAFGEVLAEVYRDSGMANAAWTWHEAADTSVFYPRPPNGEYSSGDVVWIGNWGDDERTRELEAFLFRPVRELSLKCHVYGVRYPKEVLQRLTENNISWCGWLANFRAPEVFANHAATVHIPRGYYADVLPGIPTIRPFEAMASGIPLITAPWTDSEHLFTAGEDFLVAHDTGEMKSYLRLVLNDRDFAGEMADRALETIRARHTCGHRVEQLLQLCRDIGAVAVASKATGTNTTGSHATGDGRAFKNERFTTDKEKKGGKHLHAVN